jgi:uncharacterized repeat protein (TIGR03803 family)
VAQFDNYVGAFPYAALIQGKDGNLYGTASQGGSNGDGAVYRLGFSGPLQITGQPADQSAYIGGTAVFTVATFGAAPVFYQWQQNGINLTNGAGISGATNAILRITNVTANDAALYTVIVSNALNSVTSDYAILEVNFSPPDITTQPVSQTLLAGMTATLMVTAVGDLPLSYQWQENGTNLTDGNGVSGSGTNLLTIASLSLTNSGTYSVIVSNPLHAVTSQNAVLTVLPPAPPGSSVLTVHLFGGNIVDGAFPYAGLIQGNDSYLYGTAEGGGKDYDGTIFKTTLTGSLTTIYAFTNGNVGAYPFGGLVQGTNGYFYGTTSAGGLDSDGTTFRLVSSTSVVTFLYSFTDGNDGANPMAGLVQASDGNFYGTANSGGEYSSGSVFKMTTNGTVTGLYGFTGNNDGAYPYAGLIQGRDGKLYGTTSEGGSDGFGTVFSLTLSGVLTTLVSFDSLDGSFPQAGVIQGVDGKLYGVTSEGGSNGYGTVYCLTTNGVLTTLFSFAATNGNTPLAAVVQGTDGNLYGTTSSGGLGGQGTAFRITTNGTLNTLLWFDGLNGADPEGAMVQASDGNFYGTTAQGGTGFNPSAGGGSGLIFRLTVPIFISNSITLTSAISGLPYSSAISNFAVAPLGDALTFSIVSGPSWLNVATNGALSGAPANSNIGTNTFVVGLMDSNGVFATTSILIPVVPDPPPTFISNPFTESSAGVGQAYSATIATNATDAELGHGDILSFAKVSGPAWLNVASNGLLSGTPGGGNGGTNTFVVSVINLAGGSNIATLSIYVYSPPPFLLQNLTLPAASVGIPYTGTIATNASDPDLSVGDTLAFYMVAGPAWLSVATNGALSGTPSSAALGVNNFQVRVVDSVGLSSLGNLIITVNLPNPPFFITTPFNEPPAMAGQNYAATIATNASDPNFGDVLTFAKVIGPAWLNIAGNGALSGRPTSVNVGSNPVIVGVADYAGLSNNAVMFINVTPAPGIVMQMSLQGSNVLLSWTGGVAPYQVIMTTNLNSPVWQNVGSPANSTNLVLAPSNVAAFYEIQGH